MAETQNLPKFDLQAAREAGHSDEEITGYLSDKLGFDLKGAMKAGYSQDEIFGKLISKVDTTTAPLPEATPQKGTGFLPSYLQPIHQIVTHPKETGKALWEGVKQFYDETKTAVTVGAEDIKTIPYEVETFNNIRKNLGMGTAVRAWGAAFRGNYLNIPLTHEEEQSLADDFAAYNAAFPDDPADIQKQMQQLFKPTIRESDWEQARLGLVNIGTALLPGGKVGRLAAGPVKNLLLKKVVEAEAHAIASFVAWEVGRAQATGEDKGEAALRGAALGAVTPPILKGVGKTAGLGLKGTAKAAKILGIPIKQADALLQRVEAYSVARKGVEAFGNWWVLPGQFNMERQGLKETVDSLIRIRANAHTQAAGWTIRMSKLERGLTAEEKTIVGKILTDDAGHNTLKYASEARDPEKILEIAAKATEIFREVGNAAEAASIAQKDAVTGKFRQFIKRNDFGMPHVFTNTKQFIEEGPIREEALKRLQDQGMSLTKAKGILKKIHYRSKAEMAEDDYIGYAALMGRRYNLPGYVMDPFSISPSYFYTMAHRIQNTIEFGPKPVQVAGGISEQMVKEGLVPPPINPSSGSLRAQYPRAFEELDLLPPGSAKRAAEYTLEKQLGAFDAATELNQTLTKAMQYQAITKLGFSPFAQLTQFAAPNIVVGWRDSIRDMLRLAAKNPEYHDEVARAGGYLETMVRHAQEQYLASVGPVTQRALKFLTVMDTAARQVGVVRGLSMASHIGEELATMIERRPVAKGLEAKFIDKEMDKLSKKLIKLGVDPVPVIERGGILTRDEALRVGQTISTDVNFWTDALSIPAYWKKPGGRFVTQFKTFIYQWTTFLNKAVVQPAVRDGDLMPFFRFLVAAQVSGEIINDIRSVISGRKRPNATEKRIIENFTQFGALGIVADAFRATNFYGGLLGFASGPTVSTIAEVSDDILHGRERKLKKHGINFTVPFIPYVGPILAPILRNRLLPYKRKKKEEKPGEVSGKP